MVVRTALSVLFFACAMEAAVAESVDCATLVDAARRLRCYDKSARPVLKSAAGAMKDPDIELIALAKNMLRGQLRKPRSAQFAAVSVKTAADGSKAVCGMVDSQNDTDGRTGPKPFVYDGRNIYVLISSDGAENGTIHDGPFLDRLFERAKDAHSKFCRG